MSNAGTPIAWPLRAWLAAEVLFGVGAVLAIGVAPADSATNFAWAIQPTVMAAVLGAFYFTSAPLFILPLFAKRWEMLRAMALPAAAFCLVQLLTTLLHWDKFSVGSLPFYVWFASYLLPPPIFVAAYVWQQRRAAPLPLSGDHPLDRRVQKGMQWLGVLLAAGALVVFMAPSVLIPHFPWLLTALTARSLSGWILLMGVLLLALARENDRDRVLLATPILVLTLPALLVQMHRYAGQVDWQSGVLWGGLAIFALLSACGLHLALRGHWRETLR